MEYSKDISTSDRELGILLVGKTGAGKSSTGNTLVGNHVFETATSLTSVTMETQYGEAVRFGRPITIVDTPGLYNTKRSNTEILRDIVSIFGFWSPGIHVLLYIMDIERFTRECIRTRELILKTFGEDICSRMIIVITHFDDLQTEHVSTEQFLASGGQEFLHFKNMCSNRVFFLNNKAEADVLDQQVLSLIKMADVVLKEHDGKCLTHLKLVRTCLTFEKRMKEINLSRARRMVFERTSKTLGLPKVAILGDGKYKFVPTRKTILRSAHTFSRNIPAIEPKKTGNIELKMKQVSFSQKSVPSCKESRAASKENVKGMNTSGQLNDSGRSRDETRKELGERKSSQSSKIPFLPKVVVTDEDKDERVPVPLQKGSTFFVLPCIRRSIQAVGHPKRDTSEKLRVKQIPSRQTSALTYHEGTAAPKVNIQRKCISGRENDSQKAGADKNMQKDQNSGNTMGTDYNDELSANLYESIKATGQDYDKKNEDKEMACSFATHLQTQLGIKYNEEELEKASEEAA